MEIITVSVKQFEIANRHSDMFVICSTFQVIRVYNFIIIIADLIHSVFQSTPLSVCSFRTRKEPLVMYPTFIVRFLIVLPAGVLLKTIPTT